MQKSIPGMKHTLKKQMGMEQIKHMSSALRLNEMASSVSSAFFYALYKNNWVKRALKQSSLKRYKH